MQSGLSARAGRLAREERPALLAAAFGLALAAALFQVVVGWEAVTSAAPIWRDPPGALAGPLASAEAILRERWTFPLAATPRLAGAEAGLAIQNGAPPWPVLAVKALGAGGWLNPLGLYWALAWLAQPLAMIALLRVMGARRWPILAAGAALSLTAPAWLASQIGGPQAAGHAVPMLALALSIASARQGLTPGRILGFCVLTAAAVGLFSGHAAVVGALFAAAGVSEIAQGRPRALARFAGAALRVGLAAGLAAFALNGWGLSPKVGAAVYPGAGALLAIAVAAGLWIAARGPRVAVAWRRFGPLIAVVAALAAWALAGSQPAGPPGRFRLEDVMLDAAWYGAVALALTALDATWRPRWTWGVLVVVLGLQAVDVGGLIARTRGELMPTPPDLAALRSPGMDGRAWVLVRPCAPDAETEALLDRVALIAVRSGGRGRVEPGCRPPPELLAQPDPQDPRVLVTLDETASPSGRDDCRVIGRLRACGRGLAGTGAASDLRRAYVVDFTGGRTTGLGRGWSVPEPQGVWSAKPFAGIEPVAPVYGPSGMVLEFELHAYPPAAGVAQPVIVSHNAARLTRWQVTAAPGIYRLEVPPGLARPGELFPVEFYIPEAVPVSRIVPGSSDERRLGVFLTRVRISPLSRTSR